MKKSNAIFFVVTVLLFPFFSCNHSVETPNQGNNNPATVTSGTWKISSFTQRGENKTSDFEGVNFIFSTNGTFAASGTRSASGTWSATTTTFTINSGAGSPFNRLNEPWKIAEVSATTVKLDHPEADENEHVTFTKQ